jgi:hypothetical protein
MKSIERLKQYQEFHEEMETLFEKIAEAFGLSSGEFYYVKAERGVVSFNYEYYDRYDPSYKTDVEFTEEEFNTMIEDFDNSVVKIKLDREEAERKAKEEREKKERLEIEANRKKYKTELENLAKSYGLTDIAKYEKAVEQLKTKYKSY